MVVGGSLPPILPLSPAVRRPSITLFYPRAIPFSYTPLYKQAIGVCELPCLMENVILWFCPCTLFCPCVVLFGIFWSSKVGDAGNGGFGCAIGRDVLNPESDGSTQGHNNRFQKKFNCKSRIKAI